MTHKNKHKDELGPSSAGQSGDLQQLLDVPDADSESVEELVEEGNASEAEAVQGVVLKGRAEADRKTLAEERAAAMNLSVPEKVR